MSNSGGGYRSPDDFTMADVGKRVRESLPEDPWRILWYALGILAVILVIWTLSTLFYVVDVQESAVVLRFGKHLERVGTVGPGLHMKLPFGVDRAYKEKVKEHKRVEFGYRTIKAGIETQYEEQDLLMLTGDLNVANVRWTVRYKIKDLPDYVFRMRNPRATVIDVADAVMRRVVGDYSVDEVLTISRQEIQVAAQEQMQERLNHYKVGIAIIAVRLKESTPPAQVSNAFNEVNRARQEKQTLIQKAEGLRNRQIPAARGKREQMILEAEGYKVEKVNNAEGDVAEFEAVLKEYLSAQEITRQRLYIETMARILPQAGKKFIIQPGADVLKLLPMGQLTGEKGGAR